MNSLENSAKTSNSQNEILPPGVETIKTVETPEDEQQQDVTSEEIKKSLLKKAWDAMLSLKGIVERQLQKEGGFSFEKIVGKGVLGFAVVSVLMSAPQFNETATAAEESPIQKEYVLDKNGATPEVSQASIEKLNQEFSDFADANQKEGIAAAHPSEFENADNYVESPKEKAKRETIVGFLQLSNSLSAEDAEKVYVNNKAFLDENFKDILGGNGEATSSIDLLPEGGVMFKFSGDLDNIKNIPEALMANLKEIKGNPAKFLSMQLLNMIVSPHKLDTAIDEHKIRENEDLQ